MICADQLVLIRDISDDWTESKLRGWAKNNDEASVW